jgi:hypothetical protein
MRRRRPSNGEFPAASGPDAALDADIALLGKKGRGKTYTAKGLVEGLLQMGRRVIVLDPLSVWWGLKASANGRSPGFPIVVFGGPKADIPIRRMKDNVLIEGGYRSGKIASFQRAREGSLCHSVSHCAVADIFWPMPARRGHADTENARNVFSVECRPSTA